MSIIDKAIREGNEGLPRSTGGTAPTGYKPFNQRNVKLSDLDPESFKPPAPVDPLANQKAQNAIAMNAAEQGFGLRPVGPAAVASARPAPVVEAPAASAPLVSGADAQNAMRNTETSLRAAAPATAVELSNQKMGLPVDAQRSAIEVGTGGLREANRIQAASGDTRQTFNLGNYDGNATIYGQASKGGRVDTFTGTGEGSSGYENSQQYKDGVARAAAERTQLAGIEAGKKEQTLLDNLRGASVGTRGAAAKELRNYYRQQEVDKTLASNEGIRRNTNALELRKMQVEQLNKDREFMRNQTNDAFSQNKDRVKQRDDAQASFNKQLETIFVGEDGKPDAARVADASAKVQETLGNRIRQLQAVPKDNANYAQAQSLAKKLGEEGLAALDDEDKAKLLSAVKVRNRTLETKSILPWGSTPVDSDLDGYSLRRTNPNLIGSDELELANGSKVRANDLRYTDPSNRILPDIGRVRTTEFEAGLGLRRKEK